MSGVGPDKVRLRWLRRAIVVAFAVLVLRLFYLQIYMHPVYLDKGYRQWLSRESVPAERGNIYDRNGKSLAISVTTWRLGVSTSLAKDPEGTERRLAKILPEAARGLADRIREAGGRHIVFAPKAVLHRDALSELEAMPEITRERMHSRIYPFDGTAASLIGVCRENTGDRNLTGLEQAYDDLLSGEAGEGWRNETAKAGGSAGLEILRKPVDGLDITLTLDAELQEISEELLADAVDECNAAGGIVMIADPNTGEILAAADTPVILDRVSDGGVPNVWDNFNFTGVYEPGSVFKIFTTAFLLRHGVIDTSSAYDCDDMQFDGYRIHNSEETEFGELALYDAFAHSINIYFARGVLNLTRDEFHRDLVEFGFGAPANIRYPGKALGLFRPPAKWSKRTLSTMAIGQELAVTPWQLVAAMGAVANGGNLMAPHMIREIRDKDRNLLERFRPLVKRRLLDRSQAAIVMEAMQRVVSYGTGRESDPGWISSAGKTGTAQKAIPGKGYVPGLYMSSYLGVVPADAPRLVILTMLDEPDYTHHYAAQSAAPLFARIVTEIGRSTDWLGGFTSASERPGSRSKGRKIAAPDLLYLEYPAAKRVAEGSRLVLELRDGAGGGSPPDDRLVISQTPAPGRFCVAGDTMRVVLAPRGPDERVGAPCPDLMGMSNRQARRTATRLGMDLICEGTGYVVAQDPKPGARLTADGIRIKLEMK